MSNGTKTTTIENDDATMMIEADSTLPKTEITKAIRAAIKEAVKLGLLPKAKYSVRHPYHGMIRVVASELPFRVLSRERIERDGKNLPVDGLPWMSVEALAVETTLEQIANAWNWDASRPEEDLYLSNYSLDIDLASVEGRDAERAAIAAEIAGNTPRGRGERNAREACSGDELSVYFF